LRVGIDGRSFASPAAGVRRYVSGLVHALRLLDEPVDVVALGGDRDLIPAGVPLVPARSHPPTNAGWALVGLPRTARDARVDVIHAPAYTAPFSAPAPVVVTIHDVSYARHPEWYPYRRDLLRRWFYRQSARSAALIVTDSDFSASEIVAAYGIDRARIAVVPLGVDDDFGPPAAECEGTEEGAPYLLHVGDLHERRNLGVVVEALAQARRTSVELAGLSLVLAGRDAGSLAGLREIAARAGCADTIDYVGMVSDERLRTLYRGASALVYPSRYEGFGLPLIEAMASGTPVIAARAASIPEVVGAAGLLLPPGDVDAWAGAIAQVMGDPARRAVMRTAGLRRAAQFTWARTARMTLDVYRRAAHA
jgi:glycosyltransferase involved in cell wall biosynthesis